MLATKNSPALPALLALTLLSLSALTGCTPAGPRALLDGERLLKDQKYPQAVSKLEVATRLLPANAQAWNHLGLAYHKAGQLSDALKAYEQARRLDPNLSAARYNLGCLLLEQDNSQAAATELTGYTVLNRDSADGFLKLGLAQMRTRQWDSAERSLQTAVRIQPSLVEAWNALGVIHTQRKRPKEALTCFTQALQKRADYPPAVLNLAILNQHYLNNRPLALQRYEEYLQLEPKARDLPAVQETIHQLRAELNPPVRRDVASAVVAAPATQSPAQSNALASPRVTATVTPGRSPADSNGVANSFPVTNRTKPATNLVAMANDPRTIARPTPEPPRRVESSAPAAPPVTPKPSNSVTPAPLNTEIVHLTEAPQTKPAQDSPVRAAESKPATTESGRNAPASPQTVANAAVPGNDSPVEKRRLISPSTWFRPKKPVTPGPTPLEPAGQTASTPKPITIARGVTTLPSATPRRRYAYQNLSKPAAGNRRKAESFFTQALQAHRERRLTEAIDNYREAAMIDPSFFEAHYNLGLAAYELKRYPESLSAYETALSINPSSANARFNFALALDQAGYYQDAANESEVLLEQRPDEARCHFLLANLYVEKLGRPDLARPHYRRVLELEPAHPQASAIRYWLAGNP